MPDARCGRFTGTSRQSDSRGRLVRAILTGTDEQQAGSGGGKGGSSYHMASFDYAYNCVAAMEWLFQQGK